MAGKVANAPKKPPKPDKGKKKVKKPATMTYDEYQSKRKGYDPDTGEVDREG